MKKKVMLLGNSGTVLYNFRKELIEKLLSEGLDVVVSCPYCPKVEELLKLGCKYSPIEIERHGKNPFSELKLIGSYYKSIKKVSPDLILTYTIKPTIYGGLISRLLTTPYIVTITGLGTAFQKETLITKMLRTMYRISLSKSVCIYMQNPTNYNYFKKYRIAVDKLKLVNGSGVNINEFALTPYPHTSNIKFLYMGRIVEDKGINELLNVAKMAKSEELDVTFEVIGAVEGPFESKIKQAQKYGEIIYHGLQSDVKPFIRESSAVLLPSYHEGMPNSLLEAAAMGRPLIASNIPGCQSIIIDGYNGLLHDSRSVESLYESIFKFTLISLQEREKMGTNARLLISENFDRKEIVREYWSVIENVLK